jgi:hypothetical protein
VTANVIASRNLATLRCLVEERLHGEWHARIAEHEAELAGEASFEKEGVRH